MDKNIIFHITTAKDWQNALKKGHYSAASLDSEGFIHSSTAEQVTDTANRFFSGQKDLVLLCFDASAIRAPLKYEAPLNHHHANPKETGLYPHIYGVIHLDEVVEVLK